MLSDEERIAFNYYKGCNEKDLENYEYLGDVSKKQAKYLETLLNLIEKQQKEIEELKENSGYHLGFIDGGIAKRYEYEDKIKAKIEELDYNDIGNFERRCKKEVLQSLLEKE